MGLKGKVYAVQIALTAASFGKIPGPADRWDKQCRQPEQNQEDAKASNGSADSGLLFWFFVIVSHATLSDTISSRSVSGADHNSAESFASG
jgi:hypothetical protein